MTYREVLETKTRYPSYSKGSNAALAPNDYDTDVTAGIRTVVRQPCPQLPGTIFRIFIPGGATVNFFNLIEATSPSGICFILRLPFLGGTTTGICGNAGLQGAMDAIRAAGGTVEVVS